MTARSLRGVALVISGVATMVAAAALLGWVNDFTRHPHSNAVSAPLAVLGALGVIGGFALAFFGSFETVEGWEDEGNV